MSKKKEGHWEVKNVLKGQKLPILTIDTRWHELFPKHAKTSEIKKLENHVNKLLKEQGKLVDELKKMHKLKATLIQNIVYNMDGGGDDSAKIKNRQQERDQKMVAEINDKMEASQERLAEIPNEVKEANQELLIAGMKVCYDKLYKNKIRIAQAEEWVAQAREELKERILEKQDWKMENDLIYSTMHALVGAKVIDIFDDEDRKREDGK